MKIKNLLILSCLLLTPLLGQIREYTVKKTDTPIVIDGILDEAQWKHALLTEPFVTQESGASVVVKTQAKLLWDNENLYIGFIASDPDVWGKMTARDSHLWNEEPVEVFIDPNNDKFDYIEFEFNPLGTELDIFMDKAYSEGGSANFGWNLVGLRSAVSIAGTLNNPTDTDTAWYCELAIPFSGIDAKITSPLNNPPIAGELWRLNLARYNRARDSNGNEINAVTSCWNKTGTPSFHVPEKFGRIIFTDELVVSVKDIFSENYTTNKFQLIGNYPNPFNPSTKIAFNIPVSAYTSLKVYNILGQKVATLVNKELTAGYHEYKFDASTLQQSSSVRNLSSGLFFARLESNGYSQVKKMFLIK